jgi:hypothetical protein
MTFSGSNVKNLLSLTVYFLLCAPTSAQQLLDRQRSLQGLEKCLVVVRVTASFITRAEVESYICKRLQYMKAERLGENNADLPLLVVGVNVAKQRNLLAVAVGLRLGEFAFIERKRAYDSLPDFVVTWQMSKMKTPEAKKARAMVFALLDDLISQLERDWKVANREMPGDFGLLREANQ